MAKGDQGFIFDAGVDRFVGKIAVKFFPVWVKMRKRKRAFTAMDSFISRVQSRINASGQGFDIVFLNNLCFNQVFAIDLMQ